MKSGEDVSFGEDYFGPSGSGDARGSGSFGAPMAAMASDSPTVATAPPGPPRGHRDARLVMAVVGAVLVLSAAAIWWFRPISHSGPVVLPETLSGIPIASNDFGASESWLQTVGQDLPGVSVAGRGFSAGPGSTPMLVNVVVARTDLTGHLDVRLGSAPYTKHSDVSCTHTFDLQPLGGAEGPSDPRTTDRMLLCFRTGRGLSVSALAIGAPAGYEGALAAVVDQIWGSQP